MTHPSGLPDAVDRSIGEAGQRSVVFYGRDALLQGGELNELQTIGRQRARRISNLVADDGDRIIGADAIVDVDAETVTLSAGEIYIDGDVLPVAGTVLAGVSMTGRVEVGVRMGTAYITHEDDPDLLGQVPGSLAEGEPGAAREIVSLTWGLASDSGEGKFAVVYVLQDGTILDQTPPPALSGITNAIATYDFAAHGHYIVSGCRVTALGKTGEDQVFSIEQGEANVHGIKLVRRSALRVAHTEDWDVAAVPGETHAISGSGAEVLTVSHAPIDEIISILLTKERTVSVTRGATANGQDALPDNSVTKIVSVVQGGTTYTKTADYVKSGDSVSWAPGGAEPAGGSSYTVTYRYRASVTADSVTGTTVTVSGGVAGGEAIIAYTWKLPRIDLMCLGENGQAVYVKGVSSASNTLAPAEPTSILKLAEIHNSWDGKPVIVNNGIYNRTFAEIDRMANAFENLLRLTMIERSKSSIDSREPVAKKNMFVDPFIDDTYRDAGEAQTAAIGNGMLQLPITPTFYLADLAAPVTLDYTEEVIISQELSTGCEKINPYHNFTPLPAAISLEPAVDFWNVDQTVWTSGVTLEFNRGARSDNGPLEAVAESTEMLGSRTEQAEFLREIDITAHLSGMGAGENLATLTFDGIDVKPAGTQTADGSGNLDVTFAIPANVTAGSKLVDVTGEGGSTASAVFTGQGVINISTMRQVTTIDRWTRVAVASGEWSDSGSTTNRGGPDPQAQTFTPPELRQVIGIDFKLCAIGDEANDLLVNQVTVENGWPTTNIEAEALVDMAGAAGWKSARFSLPLTTSPDREHAFVIKTDDGEHAISVANLGDFDVDNQQWVSAAPYPVGVRLSSVNARTWTAHQKSALTFRAVAARYTATTKTVDLGTIDLVNCSDLQIRAAVELPSGDCSVVFEVERPNGTVVELLPFQVLQLNEFITETVVLRAKLKGTAKLSPILYAPVAVISGEIATTATYVTRAFDFGSDVRLTSYLKAFRPAGSGVAIDYDLTDANWQPLPLAATEALAFNNWTEPKHEETGITGARGRIRLTLTGGPGARPVVGDFGAAIF